MSYPVVINFGFFQMPSFSLYPLYLPVRMTIIFTVSRLDGNIKQDRSILQSFY